jgi:hypothetical protein
MAPRPHRLQFFKRDGRWWYVRRAGNHQIVEESEQGFRSRWYAKRRAVSTLPAGTEYVIEELA